MKLNRASPPLLQAARAIFFVACAGTAHAHDTWFEALSGNAAPGGTRLLALGTGNQVPVHEFAVAPNALVRQGCVDADGRSRALQPQLQLPTKLLLRTTAAGALSCWAQLVPFDIDLPADKLGIYFDEIRPSPEVLAAWASMQARGLPWRERYVKHARIELPGNAAAAGAAVPVPAPSPLGMDLLLLADPGQVQAGDTLNFQLLRDGKPLPGLALELRSEAGAGVGKDGIWGQTDSAGQVRLTVPKAGAWVLRGTELRVSTEDPARWDSRFITLAFQVQPKP